MIANDENSWRWGILRIRNTQESQVWQWSTELNKFLRNYRATHLATTVVHAETALFVRPIKLLEVEKADDEMRKYDRTTKAKMRRDADSE